MTTRRNGPGGSRGAALSLLGRRDYTVRELRDRLAERGYGAPEIDTTIAELCSAGLLDDRRVAAAHLRTAARVKGRGRVRIAHELAARGVAADVVDEAVSALSDAEEASAIERLLVRRRLPPRPSMPERRKLFQQLLRRGFRADVIAKVLRIRQDEDV
jgi:regulatory protein